MHDFARAAKAHGLLFCPIRDKMDPDHIEIAILQDNASKANRIIEKLQLDVVDIGTAELVDAVQQKLENAAPNHEDAPAFAWNCRILPPTCAARSSRRKTVCRRCR